MGYHNTATLIRAMQRPSFFTPELAAAICDRIAIGRSLRSVCEDVDMPSRESVRRWLRDHEEFRTQYADAHQERADAMFEDMLAIADDATLDPADRKVRIGMRQWAMARVAPKKYGQKVELTGNPDAPLVPTDTVAVARRLAFMFSQGAAEQDRRPKQARED